MSDDVSLLREALAARAEALGRGLTAAAYKDWRRASEELGEPDRIARLLDRLEAADAEVTRLNQCLQFEQHRSERIGTHGPGCHAWGPAHYECAMAALQRRTELLREAQSQIQYAIGCLLDQRGHHETLSGENDVLKVLARIDAELENTP